MNWSQLLSPVRLGGKICPVPLSEKKYPRSEFQKDYKRIISCASFRRLQDKTQVFPLDQSDFVRTRLTHSSEVSAIAETMGHMLITVCKRYIAVGDCVNEEAIKDIPDILSCAGLLHDIGNPPFGHFGEEIIKKWFTCNLKNYSIGDTSNNEKSLEVLIPHYIADLVNFDGNAQALRVLTKLHFQDGDHGLNLTSAVLNTLIKYPTCPSKVKEKGQLGYNLITKKMGYTEEDRDFYDKITDNTGAKNCRHPLAFVLEAADDTAYKTADLEDGLKKGLYTLDELLMFINDRIDVHQKNHPRKQTIAYVKELFHELNNLRKKCKTSTGKHFEDPDLYAIQNWVPYAQEWMMYCAIFGFDIHYASIMNGSHLYDLFYNTNHEISVSIIDEVMKEFIYPNRGIMKLELAADTILTSLLDKFTRAVLYHDKIYCSSKYVEIQAYQKLYSLISDNHRGSYELSLDRFKDTHTTCSADDLREYDIYLRLLLVVDYISGMTDSYAKSLYQELNGIYGLSGIY